MTSIFAEKNVYVNPRIAVYILWYALIFMGTSGRH